MAWNETKMTMTGRVCTDITIRLTSEGQAMATFVVAANERKFDKELGAWVAGNSLFMPVRCFRKLAENAATTLVKGDPVLVTGRIHTHKYEKDGQLRSEIQMEASGIGPDLTLCQVVLQREDRSGLPVEAVAA